MTEAAYKQYMVLTTTATDAGNTEQGWLWDILKGFGLGVAKVQTQPQTCEDIITDQPKPTQCRMKAVPGPDDDGNPCITLMLIEED